MSKYDGSSITFPYGNSGDIAQHLLDISDWTQLPDSGLTDACVTAFATYRASLRTIRKTNPSSPAWPTAPTEEWS
jgi:hypothetical protein